MDMTLAELVLYEAETARINERIEAETKAIQAQARLGR